MLSKWIKARDDMEKIVKSRRRLVLRLKPKESACHPSRGRGIFVSRSCDEDGKD
jgi:hypothetical protein